MKGALVYLIDIVAEPFSEKNFETKGISTRAKIKMGDLQTGIKYWFRVLAVNAAGKSGWSSRASGRPLQPYFWPGKHFKKTVNLKRETFLQKSIFV